MKEALLWSKATKDSVNCRLCGHRCMIRSGAYGICGVRKNENGVLFSTNYGRLVASNIDPIEKKPLFHFLPGSSSMSIAAAGCNFHCEFCQNHSISQIKREGLAVAGEEVAPEKIVSVAKNARCRSVSYTYTEPTVYFEYVVDCARVAKENGLYNVWVTNGFITQDGLELMDGLIDAANVDLKAFDDRTYRKIIGGRLQDVIDTIKLMRKKKIWVEVTTLIVPGMNDSDEELQDIAQFLHDTDPGMPWHVSAYHADYKYLDRNDRTPIKTLNRAREIGYGSGLHYVYSGNIPGDEGESTFCSFCKSLLIERCGFDVLNNRIQYGNCYKCGKGVPGIWH